MEVGGQASSYHLITIPIWGFLFRDDADIHRLAAFIALGPDRKIKPTDCNTDGDDRGFARITKAHSDGIARIWFMSAIYQT